MSSPLASPVFRRLFTAQLLSLAANGLVVAALALSAYALRPDAAGTLLAAAMVGKMIVYVTVAPVVAAYIDRLPRRSWLVALDLLRAGLLLWLASAATDASFIVLVAVFYVLSAAFTPVYQAAIPDVLDETQYVRALSWSRLAQELENLAGPLLAASLLFVADHSSLFRIASVLLLLSSVAVWRSRVPSAAQNQRTGGLAHNVFYGLGVYLKTPRLRGLLALHGVVSFSGALVIINTVVLVRQHFGLADHWVPMTTAAAGVAAALSAWSVPALLQRINTRSLMIGGAMISVTGLALGTLVNSFPAVLVVWALIGSGSAFMLTPSGRIIIASCHDADRSVLFAANFSLSHGVWLLAYLCAGWVGANLAVDAWFWVHAALAGLCMLGAIRLWPRADSSELVHRHETLDHDHLHSHDEHHQHVHEGWEGPAPHRHPHHHDAVEHEHPFVIDEHHRHWPR